MSKKLHLVQRNGVWYYRQRVPQHLIPVIRKKVIQYSLKTKDLKEAAKRRPFEDIKWDALFQDAEEAKENGSPTTAILSRSDALRIVREYVVAADKKFQTNEAKTGPVTEEQKKDIEHEIRLSEWMLSDLSNPEASLEVGDRGHKLLAQHGVKLPSSTDDQAQFFEFVRRAMMELYRRSKARHQQDFSKSYFDKLFGPEGHPAKSVPSISFSELSAEYIQERTDEAKFKSVSKTWVKKIKATLRLVEEIIGPHTPIVDIDYDACVSFRNTLARVPKNKSKLYEKLPLASAIAAAEEDEHPMMAYGTQQVYLQALTAVLKLAAKKGLIGSVPSVDITPHAKKIPDEDKRNPFTTDQLIAIFSAPLYTGCKDDGVNFMKPGPNIIRRARFWVPLIFLFTGMRPNEICQLYVEDLKTSEGGTHYFDIVMNKPDKKLKNLTSRRVFPVHPNLVKMGFLKYVSTKKSEGEERLFPELKQDENGYYSTQLSDWFSDSFLKTVMDKTGLQTFYSFRHSFRDALGRMEAPPDILKALGGWSQGKLVSDDYYSGPEPDQLLKYVAKIKYSGLDLSHLYVKDN